MLLRVNKFEEECTQHLNFNHIDLVFIKNEIVDEAKELDEVWRSCLHKHNLNKNEVRTANEVALKLQHRIEQKTNELNKMIFGNRSCEFLMNPLTIQEKVIGK